MDVSVTGFNPAAWGRPVRLFEAHKRIARDKSQWRVIRLAQGRTPGLEAKRRQVWSPRRRRSYLVRTTVRLAWPRKTLALMPGMASPVSWGCSWSLPRPSRPCNSSGRN